MLQILFSIFSTRKSHKHVERNIKNHMEKILGCLQDFLASQGCKNQFTV
jgi:hypothetical protein